jgi:hypothetical protein
MLANPTMKTINVSKTSWEPGITTFIPSTIFLLIAIENGWDIVNVELVPSWDQLGFAYLVTLRCRSDERSQKLFLPKNASVEKILDEHCANLIPA